jgi:hypothetical protein
VPTFVFTQDDIKPRFRGTVWDCRGKTPVPADFDAPIKSPWTRTVLGDLLEDHPDQELRSFVTRGTVSKTESLGLAMVLGPHLQSLAQGFDEVAGTINDSVEATWCGRFDLCRHMFPFVPTYSIPQGSVDKSGGTRRRTSDYGFDRKGTSPPTTPINVAARKSVWLPERKPTNGHLANDVAVLRYAADLFGEDLFLFSEDFTAWFNQFGTHGSEWFKTCFLWIQRDRAKNGEPVPAWVVEYVMGFGMMPSSGIAQRFSHALMWLLLRRFDETESARLAEETDPARMQYLRERAVLGQFQCVLWACKCYTDDSAFSVVGANRAVRLLTHWGELTSSINVITKQVKRQAGCCILWTGAFTNSFWANQIIPPEKVLRAVAVLEDVVAKTPVIFSVYRSAMGLVIHLHMLLRARRLTLYGMFRPYLRGILNPAEPIRSCPQLRAKARQLADVLLSCAGSSCADPPPNNFEAAPYVLSDALRAYFAFTDAALQGAPVPGLGGWFHGFFFTFALPAYLLGYPIPQHEFFGMILGLMVFRPIAKAGRCVGVTDSETSFKIVANDGANTDQTQWIHEEWVRVSKEVGAYDHVRHGHGETNPFADLSSRGRIKELRALARQMGITPIQLPIPAAFIELLDRFVAKFGPKYATPEALRQRLHAEKPASFVLPSQDASPSPTPATPPRHPQSAPQQAPLEVARSKASADLARGFGKGWSSDVTGDGPKLLLVSFGAGAPMPLPPTPASNPQLTFMPLFAAYPSTRLAGPGLTAPPTNLPRPLLLPFTPPSTPSSQRQSPLHTPNLCSTPFPCPARELASAPTVAPRTLLLQFPAAQPPPPPTHLHDQLPTPPRTFPLPLAHATAVAGARHRLPESSKLPDPPSSCRYRAPTTGTPLTQQRRARHVMGPAAQPEPDSPFAYDIHAGPLFELFDTIAFAIGVGVPESTLLKDDLAWSRWETFCALVGSNGTPAWRTDRAAHSGADPAGFDRESRLLCAFLLWCYEVIQPRSKSDAAASPQSAFNMVAAVRRIHKRHGITMVACAHLSAVLKGITIHHIQEHGPESILPNRKHPLSPSLIRKVLGTPAGTVLGSKKLDWSSPLFLCLATMFALGMSTGFRKAEVALPSSTPFDDRRLRRCSVVWRIGGVYYPDPSPAQLQAMVPGRDVAVVRPPRSKADPDGTKFGSNPIYLALDEADSANAAAWLRRLEIAFPCHGAQRRSCPLFFTDSHGVVPMSHSTVDTYLRHFLLCHVSAEEAETYSFHSFRIGFATSLLAAGCSYDMIQALVRWRSPQSLLIYARMDPLVYTGWIAQALQQDPCTITGKRLPFAIDADGLVAACSAAEGLFSKADELADIDGA